MVFNLNKHGVGTPTNSSNDYLKQNFNSDGSIAMHKVHLITQSHNQEFELNYMDTFVLVAKVITVCLFFTIVITYN